MNKNDPFARVFPDAPLFEVPPASNTGSGAVRGADPFAQVFSDTPRFEAPHDLIFDSDGDGFIDPWDCQPFNPEEDGWFGDAWRRVTSRVKAATRVDYGRAAARRSSVRQTVRRSASRASGRAASTRRSVGRRIAPVTRRVRSAVARAPIHVSRERAAVRRADVKRVIARKVAPMTAAVRAAVARAPIHPSPERAAERRAGAASALGVDFGRAADRRAAVVSGISAAAAPVTAAVRTAVAKAPIHVSLERAAERRAALSPYRVGESLVGGATAFAMRMSPIGVAAAAPGEPDKPGEARQRMIDAGVLKDRPTTITTGVGGMPGQPDRAGDVHADTGKRFVPKFTGRETGVTGEALVDETAKPISIFGWTPFTKEMESHVEAMTARQQAKFPEGTISKPLMWFQEKTAGVAEYIRSAEQPVEEGIVTAYPRFPQPMRRLGIGVFIKAPASAVETVGMIPVGLEAMKERPDIIPAAAAVGIVGMGSGLFTGFVTDPFGTAGELIGFGRITKAIPKVPTPKGISSATITKAARAAEVTAAKTTGAAPLRIAEAMTRIAEAAPMPRLPTTKVATPKGLAPGKSIKFEAGMKVAQRLKHVAAPIQRPLDFNVVKALRGAGDVVETWVKTHPKQNTIIGGSGAAWAQFKKARLPGDIDMYVAKPSLAGKEMYAGLVKKLGASNVRLTENPAWGSVLIETRAGTKGYWSHAVDLHPLADAKGTMEFGFATQTPTVIGGIRYVPAGELMVRKAASVLMPRGEKIAGGETIGPKPHRLKDIADFIDETKQLAAKESDVAEGAWLFKQRRGSRAAETEQLLKVYEFHAGLYGEPFIRAYGRLPPGVRRPPPVMLAGYHPLSPPAEHPSVIPQPYDRTTPPYDRTTPPYDPAPQPYKATTTPPYKATTTPPYKATTTPPYEPTTTPPYKATTTPPYEPTTTPPYKATTTPPYEPTTTPPYKATTTPPYEPTTPPYEPTTPPYDPTTPPYNPTPPPDDPTPPPPEPTKTTTKKLPRDKKKEKEKPRRRLKPRGPFDWYLEHEMMTLEGFLGGVAKPATGAFPEPDLGSPVAAKKVAGGHVRRPGLLDVPPGW